MVGLHPTHYTDHAHYDYCMRKEKFSLHSKVYASHRRRCTIIHCRCLPVYSRLHRLDASLETLLSGEKRLRGGVGSSSRQMGCRVGAGRMVWPPTHRLLRGLVSSDWGWNASPVGGGWVESKHRFGIKESPAWGGSNRVLRLRLISWGSRLNLFGTTESSVGGGSNHPLGMQRIIC